jgi:DNA-binding beta-propeller fold protein YncE
VLDATNNIQLAVIPLGISGFSTGDVVINPQTNRIYLTDTTGGTSTLLAIDGNTNI